ncbi:MAG: ImmA/IrrE family metallo-endopeptidase [Chloroflexi bacterium AL-W]|nr:ImmA/IrrE family metallo-endopeptidase [Chloroflexi bacterium AL-W]
MNEWILKKKVGEFREQHGLRSAEPIRLKSLLMKLQVHAVFQPISSKISGIAVKVEIAPRNIHRFMLVNSNQSLGRQHFSICHELYHLFVQENFQSRACITGIFDKKLDREEYHADLFAAYLLLPEEGILELIPSEELKKDKITLATLLHIEQYYSCSRSALLQRLRELGLASQAFIEANKTAVRKGAASFGYSTTLYEAGNHHLVVSDYGPKAHALYEADRISESHYLSLMRDIGVDLSQFQELSADVEADLV